MNIRELAGQIGLSKSTVADALQGKAVVNAETRLLVQTKARELGYKANPIASAFFRQIRSKGPNRKRANVALLFPQQMNVRKSLYNGIRDRADELGYAVDRINIEEYDSMRLSKVLAARGVMGVIACPLFRSVGHITLDWSKLSAVAFGYSMARPSLPRVVHNHAEGMRVAYRRCRRMGYQRIGLVLGNNADARSNGLWSSSFLGIQQRVPRNQRVKPYLTTDTGHTPEKIAKWITQEKPDAIIFHTTDRIPDLPQLCRDGTGAIRTVVLDRLPTDLCGGLDQRYYDCGGHLVELLSQQILHDQRGIPERAAVTMVEGVWMDPVAGGNGMAGS